MIFLETLYLLTSLLLAAYGLNCLYLLWRYLRTRGQRPAPSLPDKLPLVTVQLPIFNEIHTVERLLRAVAGLDYPRARLQVQILDDSTDETASVAATLAENLRVQGLHIEHIHRRERIGYKAGALAAGLERANGEFVAVFDADFVPPADFLKRTIPWFGDPQVGCVQARWTHLNHSYSILTELQALAIDGHFIIEQTARSRSGMYLNFNGTAGIWRRACIEDAGGWQADTLTEDLDLSYRAQLQGWRIEYLPDLGVPGELPIQIAAYKRQQARWAQGSLQTARRRLPELLRAQLPLRVKLESALHLTGYLVHPLILAALILAVPMNLSHPEFLRWVPLFMFAAIGPPLLYLGAAAPDGPGFWERLLRLPGLVLLGIGLSLNNGRAAFKGLFSLHQGAFLRTPKFALLGSGSRWEASGYALREGQWMWIEALAGVYASACGVLFASRGEWGFVPWMALYALSYVFVFAISLTQSLRRRVFGHRKDRVGEHKSYLSQHASADS